MLGGKRRREKFQARTAEIQAALQPQIDEMLAQVRAGTMTEAEYTRRLGYLVSQQTNPGRGRTGTPLTEWFNLGG